MKSVAAVVVTYNRKELLQENIKALLVQSYKDLDVLIIDNASNDGTYEAVSPFIERGEILYHNTGSNLGGAGGFQFGINLAVKRGYKYIWVMDDDCIPNADALENLFAADKKLGGAYGFLSSRVLWKDGNICGMNVQRRTLTKNVKDFSGELEKVVMASFVSLFVKSDVVRDVGLPIKEFFIWTDDWEFTRRISRKYPCYLANRSVVIHKSAINIGAKIHTDVPERLERYKLLYRNDVYLYRREGIKGFFYEATRLFVHSLKVLLKAKKYKIKRLKMIWVGTRDGFKFNPAIEFPAIGEDNEST